MRGKWTLVCVVMELLLGIVVVVVAVVIDEHMLQVVSRWRRVYWSS